MIPSAKLPRHLKTRVRRRRRRRRSRPGRRRSRSSTLNFYYGEMQALHDINMTLADRSITRLHRTVGLRQVDAAAGAQPHVCAVSPSARRGRGADRRRGHPRADVDVADLRYRVGMVFQKPTPFPMSVFDNVAFGLRLARRHPQRGARRRGSSRRCAMRRSGTRSRTSCTRTAAACRADSSSGYASRGPSRCSPKCSCSTSRPRRSIRSRRCGSRKPCRRCARSTAS